MTGDAIYIFTVECKVDAYSPGSDTVVVPAISSLTAFTAAFERCKEQHEYEPQALSILSSSEFMHAGA